MGSKSNLSESGKSRDADAEKSDTASSSGSSTMRGNWGNNIEFFLSSLGYAVGYGNLWRFPYLCYRNGGGAFLIPYFIFLVLAGCPLVLLEMALGQFSQAAVFGCWKYSPIFKGIGMAMVMVSSYWGMYYNVIIMWTLYYLFHSFSKVLPWSVCGNPWNTPECRPLGFVDNSTLCNGIVAAGQNISNITTECYNKTRARAPYPAEEFWDRKVLSRSGGFMELVMLKWDLALLLAASWLIVFLCLVKGIKTSGKVVYVTATAPYILTTVLLIQGATREGSLDGVLFYITPNFSKLADPTVWAEACSQIFYSVAPGWGGLITMASYNKFHTDIYKYSIATPLLNCATSFYTGFVIFSTLGYMAKEAGVPVDKVVDSGPGLMFVAYPYALSQMPVPQLWCVLFFIMLLTVGLDSQFAAIETFSTAVSDEFPQVFTSYRRKMVFTGLLCATLCVIGFFCCTHAGIYMFQLLDWYVAVFTILFITLMEVVSISWIYGADRFLSDIEQMIGRRPTDVWKYMWKFVTPLTTLAMLIYALVTYQAPIYKETIVYPAGIIALFWIYGVSSSIPIPAYAAYLLFYKTRNEPISLWQKIKKYASPADDWGIKKTSGPISQDSIECIEGISLLEVTVESNAGTEASAADENFL